MEKKNFFSSSIVRIFIYAHLDVFHSLSWFTFFSTAHFTLTFQPTVWLFFFIRIKLQIFQATMCVCCGHRSHQIQMQLSARVSRVLTSLKHTNMIYYDWNFSILFVQWKYKLLIHYTPVWNSHKIKLKNPVIRFWILNVCWKSGDQMALKWRKKLQSRGHYFCQISNYCTTNPSTCIEICYNSLALNNFCLQSGYFQ